MEWPPDKEKLRRDLYVMAGSLAVMGTDIGIIFAENPKSGVARAAIGGTILAAGVAGSLAGERMIKSDYGWKDRQLTVFDEQKNSLS